MLKLRKASKKKVKIRAGFSGPSGFGKSYSALLVAYGLCGDWNRIALIDSENNSADLYSDLGPFNVLPIKAPFSPEMYQEAIHACEADEDIEVIIIDSISHEWEGVGGCLEIVESLGGKYQNWAQVTPRHQAFITAITDSRCHVFTTVRRKQDYEMSKDNNGKIKVEKAGLKEVTREGFEYELTINFEFINDKHFVKASKDRTGMFINGPEFKPSIQTGQLIKEWCEREAEIDPVWIERVNNCKTKDEVILLYNTFRADIDHDPRLQLLLSDRRKNVLNEPAKSTGLK